MVQTLLSKIINIVWIKELFTNRHSDEKITHYSAASDEYQAAWIAGKISGLHREGKSYHDIAILYRSNYLSRSLEKHYLMKEFHTSSMVVHASMNVRK